MGLNDLDPLLSPVKRLAALGMLANTDRVDFAFMASHLELGDSDLSKQMRALADAGYVNVVKTGSGSKRRTWFSMTTSGRIALTGHIEALQSLVLSSFPPPDSADIMPISTAGGLAND